MSSFRVSSSAAFSAANSFRTAANSGSASDVGGEVPKPPNMPEILRECRDLGVGLEGSGREMLWEPGLLIPEPVIGANEARLEDMEVGAPEMDAILARERSMG